MGDVAKQIKEARKGAGLTQPEMAKKMIIPLRTLQKWETGERTPPPYVLRFILNELEQVPKIEEEGEADEH